MKTFSPAVVVPNLELVWRMLIVEDPRMLDLVLAMPALLLGIGMHEYAHARAADYLGDPGPRARGRLSLNPIDHLDPLGSALLLFLGFGWGKSVQVQSSRFRDPQRDSVQVALAGPMSNIAMCSIACLLLALSYPHLPANSLSTFRFLGALEIFITVNGLLALLNMLPIRPLDGEKIFRFWASDRQRIFLSRMQASGPPLMLLFILFLIAGPYLLSPLQNYFLNLATGIRASSVFFLVSAVLWGIYLRGFAK